MTYDIEEIIEIDDGGFMGIHIKGHVEDDVAVPLLWAHLIERGKWGYHARVIDRPRRTYVRKVPCRDEYGYPNGSRYAYTGKPGPGAVAVTRVEVAHLPKPPTCALCPWDSIMLVGPDATPLCRAHAVDDLRRRLPLREVS